MVGLIVAYAKNRVIGNKGCIPWQIEGEQERFRKLTTGNIIIMGRRTYEEIGHPLPKRVNIVISSTKNFTGEKLYTVKSLAEALSLSEKLDKEEGLHRDIYLSGGSRIYAEGLSLCERLYVTEVELEPEGDAYFPEFDETAYDREVEQQFEGPIPFTYVTYTRK